MVRQVGTVLYTSIKYFEITVLNLGMWDFVMDKSGAAAGFLRELRFVSPDNLHSICFSTIIFTITRGCHNRPGVAAVPIASQTRIKKKKKVGVSFLKFSEGTLRK
jgi:hypothetical protein